MNLDKQIQVLIDDAPQDGVTKQVIAAIAPVLKLLAQKLHHSQYYILQNLDQSWILTTLSNRTTNVEKCVIYAWATLQDIPVASTIGLNTDVIAVPIPVTHLLFQLTALEGVDSIIFFTTPGDLNSGIEMKREDIQNLIQLQLKQNPPVTSIPSQIPPDIA